MQAGIVSSRTRMDSMSMLCRSPESAATTSATDLLSQCTTEWSRYFIASRIASCAPPKYTAALAADLSPQQTGPESAAAPIPYRSRGNHFCIPPVLHHSATASAAIASPTPSFGLDSDDSSSAASSTSSDDATAASESPTGAGSPPGSPTPLRKVASCLVTAGEKSRKLRVQFADEVGQALTRVRFLSEPLHLPGIYMNSSAGELTSPVADTQQQQQQSEFTTHLKCKFSQPSSRYIVFRESVERNLVCLSLVHLDFSTIRGAIAVKNVSFHKRVFARFTFDSWRSFRDADATFNGSEGLQDNFSFSVQCPSDQVADIQFCVCFECDSGTFWDSNGGENYRISVSRPAAESSSGPYTRDFKPNYCGITNFSEFSVWEHFTDRVYY